MNGGGRGKALVCSQNFADSMGCSSTSSAEMLQCLRQITNEEQILNVKLVCLLLGGGGRQWRRGVHPPAVGAEKQSAVWGEAWYSHP